MKKKSEEVTRISYREKAWRSLAKTLSWRITATLTTMIISYLIIGDLTIASLIGGFEFFSKMLLYYIHERLWNKIHFGFETKPPPTDYQI